MDTLVDKILHYVDDDVEELFPSYYEREKELLLFCIQYIESEKFSGNVMYEEELLRHVSEVLFQDIKSFMGELGGYARRLASMFDEMDRSWNWYYDFRKLKRSTQEVIIQLVRNNVSCYMNGSFGRNKNQYENYCKVCETKKKELSGFYAYQQGDDVVGYVFLEDGRYTKHYLGGDLDNIAKFICNNDKDKLICNRSDYAIASTLGKYLDVCVTEILEPLKACLGKYQNKGKGVRFKEFS